MATSMCKRHFYCSLILFTITCVAFQGCAVIAELTHADCKLIDRGSISNVQGVLFGTPQAPSVNTTYSWSNGNTTHELAGVAPGNYSVTVTEPIPLLTLIYNSTFNLMHKVQWSNNLGVAIIDEEIYKYCASFLGTCLSVANSYASSSNLLKSTDTEGSIEFKIKPNASGNYRLIIGLFDDNSSDYGSNNMYLRFLSTNGGQRRIMEIYKNNSEENFINSNSSRIYNPNSYFTIKKSSGYLHVYENGSGTPIASVSLPSNDLYVKAYFGDYSTSLLTSIEAGFQYVRTSFSCPPPALSSISNEYHLALEKSINDSYHSISGNNLHFKFTEEYKPSSGNLKYLLYPYNTYGSSLDVSGHTKTYGDNRVQLDVSSVASGIHVLEVRNEKNEKWFLKFMKN